MTFGAIDLLSAASASGCEAEAGDGFHLGAGGYYAD
jgi:hypothetical protein